ncbi:MAG: DUF1961 family protein [Chitinivibrionales bacterium]|nr:DUF1961 family protein [Chitinivibrionales bacterium]
MAPGHINCQREDAMRLRIVVTFALLCLVGRIVPAWGGVLFFDGFESGSLGEWTKEIQNEGGSTKLEVSGTRARSGSKSVRFVCSSCRRVELKGAPHTRFDWGKEYWLGYSFYVQTQPSGFSIINQHHSIPSNYNWSCPAGGNSFTIKSKSSGLVFYTSTLADKVNVVRTSGGATANTYEFTEPGGTREWHDVVMHFRYAPNNTGFMRIWLNGKKIMDHTGPTVYKYDACGDEKVHIQYLKIGLYLGGGSGEIFYDDIRVGDGGSSYSEVAPGGGSIVSAPEILRPAEGSVLTEGETVIFECDAGSARWFWDIAGDGTPSEDFGSGTTAQLTIPSGAADAGEIIVRATTDDGTGERTYPVARAPVVYDETLLLEETFMVDGGLPSGWWSEGSSKNGVKNGHLYLDANPDGDGETQDAGVIWCNTEFSGDLKIAYDVHIVSSKDNSNNMNLFMLFSDPSGASLYSTRESRADGLYRRYHDLNGYIATWVANGTPDNARFRLRDVPTFENVLVDTNTFEAHAGKTYHVEVSRVGATITYRVDGQLMYTAVDNGFNPIHDSGLLGFRTWQTELWWDNLRVYRLSEPGAVRVGRTEGHVIGPERAGHTATDRFAPAQTFDIRGRRVPHGTSVSRATGVYLRQSHGRGAACLFSR